jgi:GTP pyrophosphokinase
MIMSSISTHLQNNELGKQLTNGFNDEDSNKIIQALAITQQAPQSQPEIPRGIDVAITLTKLGVDATTLQAALLSSIDLSDTADNSDISTLFGASVANLVRNVNKLNAFNDYSQKVITEPVQAENLRRMLLAMVDDVRAVLIKLAYRTERLRILDKQSYEVRKYIARETMDIYAPLANRLGIGQLKWELEDLSFRYLDPQNYKRLAKALSENRVAREEYIRDFVQLLRSTLQKEGITAEVYGRPKHIYSIWRKMQKKKVDISDLYDLRAVRVLVNKIPTCYAALGVVHSLWQYIPKEFDDYIANPKQNGYQSLHTVVIGPQGAMVEIQIRTQKMHNFAELGVAAHWRYKEGGKQDAAVEKSIASLRSLLDEKEGSTLLEDFHADLYTDRIFVLTPQGELKELVKGATPLDFAYAIHTEIGHRCRGAKVNGRIVPLTYQLKSGEQIEILTTREGQPSRSWLNKHLGYLKSSHARSKVRHWFKQQDHEKNLSDGKTILDREKQRLGLTTIDLEKLTHHFHLTSSKDVLISIGRADISPEQLAIALETPEWQQNKLTKLRSNRTIAKKHENSNITVQGIGNLMTNFAQCCNPVAGDPIIGFITMGKGITIHRRDCINILQLPEDKRNRLIEVNWGEEPQASEVTLQIDAFDRQGLLNDIMLTLTRCHINILGAKTNHNHKDQSLVIMLSLEIHNITQLSQLMDKISELHNVLKVRRTF